MQNNLVEISKTDRDVEICKSKQIDWSSRLHVSVVIKYCFLKVDEFSRYRESLTITDIEAEDGNHSL